MSKADEILEMLNESKYKDPATGEMLNLRKPEWEEYMDDGIFMVVARKVTSGEDKFRMLYVSEDGKKVLKDWGTHPSAKGAKKFYDNRIAGGDGMSKKGV